MTAAKTDSNESMSVPVRLTRRELHLIEGHERGDMTEAQWTLQLALDKRRLLRAAWTLRIALGKLVGIAADVTDLNEHETLALKEARRLLR